MLEEPATHEMMIMGQEEIMAWLEAHPGWHPKREMAADMGKSNRYFTNALRRLIKHGEVLVRIEDGVTPEYRAAIKYKY